MNLTPKANPPWNKYLSERKSPQISDELRAIFVMVGTARFELTTSRTPSERATRLRYVPKNRIPRVVLLWRNVNLIDIRAG